MRIAICDDVRVYREHIAQYCLKYFSGESIEIQCFSTGNELLAAEREFDVLFLDIEMPGMDGIDIKDRYELDKKDTVIVFLTSHKERALEAFGRNVYAFLEKPVQWDVFVKLLERIRGHIRRTVIDIESHGKIYAICLEEIRYIEAKDKYTYVVTENEDLLVRKSMKEWEVILGAENFCRVNRSYLVHFRLFQGKSNEILLQKGKYIKLSKRNKAQIFEQYKAYLRKKMGAV